MNLRKFDILPQPDGTSCGPTCLHAVYRYFGDGLTLQKVIQESTSLEEGGTLAVLLACHALRRGYRAEIYTYNLVVFDPTWFTGVGDPSVEGAEPSMEYLIARLENQIAAKRSDKLRDASNAYIEFLRLGGRLRMEELNASLICHFLRESVPLLTGLSSTYLYQCERELASDGTPDDIRGEPTGHFVVLCGYDESEQTVRVADPYLANPLSEDHYYEVGLDRLIGAILLGVLTYDANLLVIEPESK